MSPTQATSNRDAIATTNRRFMDAFSRQDAAGLARLYTADGQLFPAHSDVVHGRPAIREFWQGAMKAGIAEVSLETVEVEAAGEQAWEVSAYTLKNKDGAQIDRGKYVVVWQWTGGDWHLHRDIWTTSLPAPTA